MDNYKITDTEIRDNSVDSQPHRISGDAEKLQKIFDALPTLIANKFNAFVGAVSAKFKGYYTKEETIAAIDNKMVAMGSGDMARRDYDSDGDGVVNDSDRLGGELPSHYATAEQLAAMMPKANFEFDEATATLKITL